MFQSSATSKPLVYLLPPKSRWDPDGCVNNSGLTSRAIGDFFYDMVVSPDSRVMNVNEARFYVKGETRFNAGQIKKMHPIILADDATLGQQVVNEVMSVKRTLCFQRPNFKVDMFSTTGSQGFKLAQKEKILEAIRGAKDGVIFYGAFHTHTMAFYGPDDDFYIPVGEEMIYESELKEALKGVGGIFAADTCHALAYESTRCGEKRFYLRDKPDSFGPLGSGLGSGLPLGCLGKGMTLDLRPTSYGACEALAAKLQYRAPDEVKQHLHPAPPTGPAHSKQDAEVEELKRALADLQERHDVLTKGHDNTLLCLSQAEQMLRDERSAFAIEKQTLLNKQEMEMDCLRRQHVQELQTVKTDFQIEIDTIDERYKTQISDLQARLEKTLAEKLSFARENDTLSFDYNAQTIELNEALHTIAHLSNKISELSRQFDERPDATTLVFRLEDNTVTIGHLENKLRDTQSKLARALDFQASAMNIVEQSFAMTEEALLSIHGARQGFSCLDHACARLTQVSLGSQARMADEIRRGFSGVQATLQVAHGAHLDAARGYVMRQEAEIYSSTSSLDPEARYYSSFADSESESDLDDDKLKRIAAAAFGSREVADLSGLSFDADK